MHLLQNRLEQLHFFPFNFLHSFIPTAWQSFHHGFTHHCLRRGNITHMEYMESACVALQPLISEIVYPLSLGPSPTGGEGDLKAIFCCTSLRSRSEGVQKHFVVWFDKLTMNGIDWIAPYKLSDKPTMQNPCPNGSLQKATGGYPATR